MDFGLLQKPLLHVFGHDVSFLGIVAFVIWFSIGVLAARALQSDAVRRVFSRFKIDVNLIAILTTILSVAAVAFFTMNAVNAAGVPLSWNAPLPGVTLSLVQIFLLIALLIAVFWISSRTKRFLFNRFLAKSGLDRSLQYAIAQIVSNVVLIVGIFIVLDNAGIHLGALTVFAGAVGVGVGFGLQNIASNFISGLVILAERPITVGDRVEVAGIAGQVQHIRARSTVIVTNDNITMIVPNTKFIDSPVTNWTYGDPRVRFRLPVGVTYGSDVDKVREAFKSNIEFDAPGGKVKLDPKTQHTYKPFLMGKIRDDKQFDVVYRTDLISPDPYPQVAFPGWGCDWTKGAKVKELEKKS